MEKIDEQGLPYFQKVFGFQIMIQTNVNFNYTIVINVVEYDSLSFKGSIIAENVVI
jgi:hypothetical protein